MDCVFCAIFTGAAPASLVCQNERTVAIMDLNQPNPYKVLVIPRRHVETIYELDENWRRMCSGPLCTWRGRFGTYQAVPV